MRHAENDCFNIGDSDNIIGAAKRLVDGHHFGVLSTVDQNGNPEVRWMSTLSFDDFPRFYTLTHPHSRKVEQIKRHPEVNWMFSNHDLSLILNLIGKARVLTDTPTLKRVWQKIENKSHAYFLQHYAKAPGFVIIETNVEVIECTSPRNALHFTISPELLARSQPSPVA
jgi:general stress protein 26